MITEDDEDLGLSSNLAKNIMTMNEKIFDIKNMSSLVERTSSASI